MVASTLSVALNGVEGSIVVVEADIGQSLPGFSIIGLPDTALADARERVRAAALNDGCPLPARKITVNLSPAALPKHGSGFDLAIAMAILAGNGTIASDRIRDTVHLGELSLDGRLRPLRGVLAAVMAGVDAGYRRFVLPAANTTEAELVPGAEVVGVTSLRHAAAVHGAELEPDDREPLALPDRPIADAAGGLDLADVIGQTEATEALVVAAAGGHHLLMLGAPGAGKSMLAARLPTILPELDPVAALRVAAVHSLAGSGRTRDHLSLRPPFEAPHHTASTAALIGGGTRGIRPGAIARASDGVLFLDEAPEFATSTLDALRQPLESGRITVHRAASVATFPARFQLVLAANPCPCGYGAQADAVCECRPAARRRYLARLSGPLLDRVDIRMTISPVGIGGLRLANETPRPSSDAARARVTRAREQAEKRLRGTGWSVNSQVSGSWLREGGAQLSARVTSTLDRALERGSLSLRGYDRVLRLAWTLCDLDGDCSPEAHHVDAAVALRGAWA